MTQEERMIVLKFIIWIERGEDFAICKITYPNGNAKQSFLYPREHIDLLDLFASVVEGERARP